MIIQNRWWSTKEMLVASFAFKGILHSGSRMVASGNVNTLSIIFVSAVPWRDGSFADWQNYIFCWLFFGPTFIYRWFYRQILAYNCRNLAFTDVHWGVLKHTVELPLTWKQNSTASHVCHVRLENKPFYIRVKQAKCVSALDNKKIQTSIKCDNTSKANNGSSSC